MALTGPPEMSELASMEQRLTLLIEASQQRILNALEARSPGHSHPKGEAHDEAVSAQLTEPKLSLPGSALVLRDSGPKNSQVPMRGTRASSKSNWSGGLRAGSEYLGLPPHSQFVFAMDLLWIGVVFHDVTLPPYIAATWVEDPPVIVQVLSICSLSFWTLDMALSFIKGYYDDEGGIELRISAIAKRYLRGWFAFDILVNSFDMLGVVLDSIDFHFQHVPQIGRLVRTARFMRILRVANRVRESMGGLTDRGLMVDVLQILIVVLWLNHIMSCMWLGSDYLGQSLGFPMTWRQISRNGVTYEETSKEFQYLTSFHWAMSQMTPGSMEVVPTNSLERICNLFCLLGCLLFASSLVSVLSARMMEVKMRRQQELKQMDELRQFFQANQVDSTLVQRIYHHATLKMRSTKPLVVDNLVALKGLSKNLRQELHFDLFGDKLMRTAFMDNNRRENVLQCTTLKALHSLLRHPMIHAWGNVDNRIVGGLVRDDAVNHIMLDGEEELFTVDSSPDNFFLLTQGSLQFAPDPKVATHTLRRTVQEGTWLAEVALWVQWKHRGTMKTAARSVLLTVNVQNMRKVTKSQPKMAAFIGDWANAFAKVAKSREGDMDYFDVGIIEHSFVIAELQDAHRAKLQQECLGIVTDKVGSMSFSMARTGSLLLGAERSRNSRKRRSSNMGSLLSMSSRRTSLSTRADTVGRTIEEEVGDGQSLLVPHGTGEIQRHQFNVALHITRPGDAVLYQIAIYHAASGVESAVELPSSKLAVGEDPDEVRAELLRQIMDVSSEHISWQKTGFEQEEIVDEQREVCKLSSKMHHITHTGILEDASILTLGHSLRPPQNNLFASQDVYYVQGADGYKKVYTWLTSGEILELKASREKELNSYLASMTNDLASPVLLSTHRLSVVSRVKSEHSVAI